MPTTEHTINDAIAKLLRETRRSWYDSKIVQSENTGKIKGSNERPDILVIEPNVSPVVIETEVLPATTVESEAISRLGKQLRTTGRTILSAVAVRLPVILRDEQGHGLDNALTNTDDLDLALYTGNSPENCSRWPTSGWIKGSIADLSILVQSASVPPDVINEATDTLVNGVNEAAGILEEMANANPGAISKISEQLHQEDGTQTRRMAATILANAVVFHESLAGGPDKLAKVMSLEEIKGASDGLSKSNILAQWRAILLVNYFPIFDIARRILEVVPTAESSVLLEGLAATADKLLQNRLMRSHDLTGAVFQRLIVDRKFLAAYYTTPASAALLVGLAISPATLPTGGSWANDEEVTKLKIADFACGTGTLLSTAYQRVSQLHELSGGDSEAIHPKMMAEALIGCDVLPAAAHLTASMLAGSHPTVKYEQSRIYTLPYGKQEDNTIALGSLDLLTPQLAFSDMLSISQSSKALEGTGESVQETRHRLPHESFDVVIMNPPFTRATGHEGNKIGVPNPMFAAFSSSEEEQREMSRATRRITRDTSGHGNAGEASYFLALAHRKLKNDGTIALVLPLSLVSGDAWEGSRELLRKNYSDLIIGSIAGGSSDEMSFSADTGMGECIVIGRKAYAAEPRTTFVILNNTPLYPLLGSAVAEQIRRLIADNNIRRIEDGPVGGTPIKFGDEVVGYAVTSLLPHLGGWNLARVADMSVAQTAYQLAIQKRIWLPTMNRSQCFDIPITTIEEVGHIGPYHADVEGKTSSGGIRGPFSTLVVRPTTIPTYPVLWSHDAPRERTIVFEADREGIPLQGANNDEQETIDLKVESVWNTASHCHFNQNFQFNSQSTAMQFTTRKTIGGRAWISIQLASEVEEKALVLWGNTSLGLLLHWWHANKQQAGRGNIGKTALKTLPVLDIRALTPKQLAGVEKVFDEFSSLELLPFNEIDRDLNRKALDEKFLRGVLGFPDSIFETNGPLDILRMKLSQEPSIYGSKDDSNEDSNA